jgi:hypothetical protein
MNIRKLRSFVLGVAISVVSSTGVFAAEAPKKEAEVAAKLIAAIVKSDYETFILDGEERFRQQTPKGQFENLVVEPLAPKLQAEHTLSYLGDFKQKGYRITLWKLGFKDGRDDLLAWLSMKDGKVGMFFIR